MRTMRKPYKYVLCILFNILFNIFNGQENCNNGLDDDGDGLIDLFDDECQCFVGVQNSTISLIPNFSFEDNIGCGGQALLTDAVDWQQAGTATPDYWRTDCAYPPGAGHPFPLPTFPLPGGGNGYVGFTANSGWQEHIGSCLSSPMLAGNTYVLSCWVSSSGFGGVYDLVLSIYGTPNCSELPFNSTNCPIGIGNWFELSSIPLNLPIDNSWMNISFNFTPNQDINVIDFGSVCNNNRGGYFYLDQLVIMDTSNLTLITDINPSGGWCTNDLVLTASTDTIGVNWQWYKDSIALVGETSPILNISQNSYGIGNYTVKLTISGQCDTETYRVELPDFPTALINHQSYCNNTNIPFNDLSTIPSGTIDSWQWDFGDGNSSTNQNPNHIYNSEGNYIVSLIVNSDLGCKDTMNQSITIYPNPLTNFTINDICLGEVSNLINSSSISAPEHIATYTWYFGDGSSSNMENPNHSYNIEGLYTVKLITESNHGCLDSLTTNTTIYINPNANFTLNNGCANTSTQFNDSSTITVGTIDSWQWDFGDGNSSTNQNPNHIYNSEGNYIVSLIVNSDLGCKDTIIQVITIHAIPEVNFTATANCLSDSILFINNSSINVPSSISNFIWNFGENNTLYSGENLKYKYNSTGIYNVSLIASSDFGCVNDTTLPIEIYSSPIAGFSSTSFCENELPMAFTDISTANNGSIITNWQWDFGDGNTSNSQFPNNFYTSPGSYNVQLIVISNNNCKDTTELPVTIHSKPNAEFIIDLTEGCAPFCTSFSDNSIANSASIIEWKWDLGNGEGSNSSTPFSCYKNLSNINDSIYSVSLIVKNNVGCYDTVYRNNLITSWHNPLAEFEVTPKHTNGYKSEVNTINNSIGANNYYWDFKNNFLSTDFEPTTNYSDTGTYNIMLVARSNNNCFDTTYQSVRIEPTISIYVPNAFTPNEDGENDKFIFQGYGINEGTTKFYIFNRWGELIYFTDNSTPWDGMNKSEKVMEDTYIYKLICKDVLGKPHEYIGHVILLR